MCLNIIDKVLHTIMNLTDNRYITFLYAMKGHTEPLIFIPRKEQIRLPLYTANPEFSF